MSVRTFDNPVLDPTPLLPIPTSDIADMPPAQTAILDDEEQWPAGEIPTSTGCLRGFCWAIGIEAVTALGAYGVWRVWTLLR
ncbi:MAG TPA: hypothetical protein VHD85_03620 [Terracidiphilus sp.]|nr:hypothetical protein [Terracidiphilus sp.]